MWGFFASYQLRKIETIKHFLIILLNKASGFFRIYLMNQEELIK